MSRLLNAAAAGWRPGCNYLETANPFGLAKPPDSFLAALYLKNLRAVIFPSVCDPVYRFCERVKSTPGLVKVFLHKPDTQILWDHKLLGITSIMPTAFMLEGGWSDRLLDHLESIRVDRLGEHAVNALQDSIQDAREAALERDLQTELDARNSSAYEAAMFRDGHRVIITGYEGQGVPASSTSTT